MPGPTGVPRREGEVLNWKKLFYISLEVINKDWTERLKIVEDNLDTKLELRDLSEADQEIAKNTDVFLLHLCKGDAGTRVQAIEHGNGL